MAILLDKKLSIKSGNGKRSIENTLQTISSHLKMSLDKFTTFNSYLSEFFAYRTIYYHSSECPFHSIAYYNIQATLKQHSYGT